MSERKQKPETDLIGRIVDAIHACYPQCYARRLNASGYRGRMRGLPKGTPDIEVLLPGGRCMHIEAKGTKATKVEPAQVAMHAKLRGMGHVVAVCRDVQGAVDAVAAEINGYRIVAKDPAMQGTADLLARVAAHGRR